MLNIVVFHLLPLHEQAFLTFRYGIEQIGMLSEVVLEYLQEHRLVKHFVELDIPGQFLPNFYFRSRDVFRHEIFGIEKLLSLLNQIGNLVVDAN